MKQTIGKGYRGNKNLRAPGESTGWTKAQIAEYAKCYKDPVYFIKKYIKIVSIDDGVIPFTTWDFQDDLIMDIHKNRFVLGLWARQMGKSTTVAAYMLWYVTFKESKECAILANKAAGAREILSRIQMAYEFLPTWLKMGVVEWNKGSVEFENGSSIRAWSTSADGIRGRSISFLLLDEFAFVPRGIADDFFKSVYPTISSGKKSKIIIISTPYGMNHYYKLWNEADEEMDTYNGYKRNFAPWYRHPQRDDKWKASTILATSPESFNQEFEVQFLGSSGTLIASGALNSMSYKRPIFEDDDGLKIYVEPKRDHNYILTVDVSEGLGLDYQAISVFDSTSLPYEQVAVYRNAYLDPLLLPDVIMSIGHKYNYAHVLVEINSIGVEVANSLYQDLEYENIMFITANGRNGQRLGGGFAGNIQYGLKSTKQSKAISCSLTKTLIENQKIIINDFDTYSEFTTFIRDKNTYNAEEGRNDDMVTTVRLFAWITGQQYFKEEMEQDIRTSINRSELDRLEDMLIPFGVLDDGLGVEDINDRIEQHQNISYEYENAHWQAHRNIF